jgi:uncharacterized membrane protein
MRCEGDERLPRGREALSAASCGTAPVLRRIGQVRLTSVLLVSAAIASAVSACGTGSAASPTFEPVSDDDSGSPMLQDASAGAVAAAFTRCGSTPPPATGTIPADVAAILTSRCQTCHQMPPVNGAPFPLLTYDDVHQLFAGTIPIYQEMYLLTQPDGQQPHMPYGNAPQLTADQLATLGSWLLACAPPGD